MDWMMVATITSSTATRNSRSPIDVMSSKNSLETRGADVWRVARTCPCGPTLLFIFIF